MPKNSVAIVRFEDCRDSIQQALALSGCLQKIERINPSDKVLIKPNLVMWDNTYPYPPYGVVTTSVVMEEVVKILKEAGCNNITIGEGASEDTEIGSGSKYAFEGLGLTALQKRYGIRLSDFNDQPFIKKEIEGEHFEIAREALETDFLVNIPVLKTHSLARVSLGFKNYVGCLRLESKMAAHQEKVSIESIIAHLGEMLYADVTLIDGIYAMERGPGLFGTACRTDVLIASADMFSADLAGALVLGFEPENIIHLKEYAARKGLSMDQNSLEFSGEPLENVVKPLKWDWPWKDDNSGPPVFDKIGVKDLYLPKFDETICTGCALMVNVLLMMVISSHQKKPFTGMEFLTGKKMLSMGGYDKTFLFGDCMIKANRGNPKIKEAVEIAGCAPNMDAIVKIFNRHGLPADPGDYASYRQSIAERYKDNTEFNSSHFLI